MRKKACTRRFCVTVICIIGVLSAGRATADESAASDPYGYSRSRLTGDWNGARNELADKGVTVNVDVLQSLQGVVDGGIEKDWKYGGSVDYEFSFNFEKLGLWPGASIDIRLEQQFGEFINTDTGSILAVNTDGLFPLPDYHEPTLSKLVFTQFLSESFAVMLGKLDTIDGDNNHFAGSRGRTNFMNQNLVFNPVAIRTAPYSSLGAGAVFFFPNAAAPRPTTLAFTVRGADGQPNTAGWDDDFRSGTVYALSFHIPPTFSTNPATICSVVHTATRTILCWIRMHV